MDSIVPQDKQDNNPSCIPIKGGFTAIVDEQDNDLAQFTWLEHRGYLIHNERGKKEQLHRIILERKLGRPIKPGMMADHANGNKLDNRRANVREATRAQNAANSKLRSDNVYGYRGIKYIPGSGKWEARIGAHNENLGNFPTAEEAAFAYDKAASERYGEFAKLNHPIEQVIAWNGTSRAPTQVNRHGFKGIRRHRKRWSTYIRIGDRFCFLGSFDTPEAAARAFDRAAIKLCGDKAITNFPIEDYKDIV